MEETIRKTTFSFMSFSQVQQYIHSNSPHNHGIRYSFGLILETFAVYEPQHSHAGMIRRTLRSSLPLAHNINCLWSKTIRAGMNRVRGGLTCMPSGSI